MFVPTEEDLSRAREEQDARLRAIQPLAHQPGHVNPLNRSHDNVTVILGHTIGGRFTSSTHEVLFVVSSAGDAQQVLHRLNEYNRTRPNTYVGEHTTTQQAREMELALTQWQKMHPGGLRASRFSSFSLSLSPILSPSEITQLGLRP